MLVSHSAASADHHESVILDEPVQEYLNTKTDPKRKALYLYLAGITHMIYAECSSTSQEASWLYSKTKYIQKRSLHLLQEA